MAFSFLKMHVLTIDFKYRVIEFLYIVKILKLVTIDCNELLRKHEIRLKNTKFLNI